MTVNIGDMIRRKHTDQYSVIIDEDRYPYGVVRLKLFMLGDGSIDYWTCPFGADLPSNLFEVV